MHVNHIRSAEQQGLVTPQPQIEQTVATSSKGHRSRAHLRSAAHCNRFSQPRLWGYRACEGDDRRLSIPTWHWLWLRHVAVRQVQPSGQRLLLLPVPAVARRRPQLPKLQPLHARLLLLLRLGLGLLLRWRWRLLLGHTQPRLLWRTMSL